MTINNGSGWSLNSCSGSTAVFDTWGQTPSTSYTVTVTTAVEDSGGTPFAANETIGFVTAAGNTAPNVPTNLQQYKLGPGVEIPAGGYTTEAQIVIEADISDSDIGDGIYLDVDVNGDNTAEASSSLLMTPQTNVQVLSPLGALSSDGSTLNWRVRTRDVAGATSAWTSLVTNPDVTRDNTAPSVSSTVPINSATGIIPNSPVTINFAGGPIDCSTVNTTNITIDGGGWSVNSCSDAQVVLDTNSQANSTTYTVSVTSAVTDQAGNALSPAPYNFSYTTNNSPNVPANPGQFESGGSPAISVGGFSTTVDLIFDGDLTDSDGDTVKLQIDYTGDNVSDCESALVASGSTDVQVSCAGLTDGSSYDWQYRAVDSNSAASAWTAYNAASPDFTVDATAPSVSSTVPTSGATDVALNSQVTINFSEDVCATVNTTSVTSDNPTWTLNDCTAGVAVFDTGGQANSTTYNVSVTSAVTDPAGNPITSAPHNFSYTTAAAGNNAPNVPANPQQYQSNGTTVINSGGYATATTVVFEADLSDPDGDTVKLQIDYTGDNASDCESAALISSGTTNHQISCSGLADGNSYNWQYRAVDSNGANSAWTAFSGGPPDFTVDATTPTVSSTTPADGATGIALDSNVTIDFSENIACATVNTTNISSDSPGWTLSSCSGAQAVFTTSGQVNSTTYNVNVTTVVTDLAGNGLSAAYPFSYTTVAAGNSPPTDITLSPNKVADGTDTSSGFNMTLGAVDPDGGETFIFTKTGAGADQARFSLTGNTLTLTDGTVSYDTPTDANADRVYEVEVQVEDSASNIYSEMLLITITPAFNPMIHSSLSTGSTKWGGDWGTATGKYGEFTCGTCHARNTGNIKRIKTTITAPNGTDQFPIEADATPPAGGVNFQDARDGSSDFGDDSRADKTQSSNICEVCHTYDATQANGVNVHAYSIPADSNHSNRSDCMTCHPHNQGFKGAGCNGCHGNPPTTADIDGSTSTGMVHTPNPTGATDPANPGAHDMHANTLGMNCNICHTGNTMPTVSNTIQMGVTINNTNWAGFADSVTTATLTVPQDANLTNGFTYVSSSAGTTVSKQNINNPSCTIYCHGDWTGSGGSNTTPAWVGGAAEATCGTCHGATAASPPTAGSHQTHAGNGAGDLGLACSKCHPSYADTAHLDGDVAWQLDTADSMIGGSATYRGLAFGTTGSKAPSAAYGNCSSTYCHGSGTPTWGGTVNCGDCHAANNSLPISHATHYGVATNGDSASAAKVNNTSVYVYQCGSCHDSVSHVDGNKDVAMDTSWGGTIDGSLVCSNVYCHSNGNGGVGNVNPQWAVTSMSCASCHDAEPATARHTAHVANGTYNFNCAECHAVTTTDGISINDTFQHVDNDKDVNWDTLNSGGDAYVNAATFCSNLYCHSNGQGGAPLTSVQWDTVPAGFGCNDCHDEARAGTGLSGAHQSHVNGAVATLGRNLGCEQCHSDTVSNSTTISSYALHVNNTKDIKVAIDNSTCNNIQCHSDGNIGNLTYNNPAWATTLGCDDCHGDGAGKSHPTYANGGTGVNANSHVTHVETASITCGECHADTSTAGTTLDGATPAQHVDQTIDVVLGTGSWDGGTDQCSTTYCHGSGTPTWGGTVNCGDCHAVNNTLPNSHATHYGQAANGDSAATAKVTGDTTTYVYQCGSCHDSVPHADGTKDVAISAGWDANGATGNWNSGTSTCVGTYCHSDGNGGAGNVDPVWATTTMTCNSCHDTEPATGDHTTHVANATYNINCAECHNVTTTNGTTINDKDQHIDGAADIDISATYDGNGGTANWSGTDCSAVYCHSDGKATPTYDTVTAGSGPANCTFCHGGAGGSNGGAGNALSSSHTVHTGTNGTTQFAYTCDDCHVQTASDNTTISSYANHVNQARDVAVAAANGGTGTIGGDYNGTGCATTNCHGSNSAGAGDSWAAGGTTGDCSLCHGMAADVTDGRDTNGDTASTDAQVGAHVVHLNNAVYDIKTITCDDCHTDPNATAGSYMDKVNTAGHMNGTAGMTWGASAQLGGMSPSYSGGSCSNTYCHDPAASSVLNAANAGTNVAPGWTDNWDNAGKDAATCGTCHDSPPGTANYDHSSLTIADDCSGCHDHNGRSHAQHIDGTLQAAGGCTGCHGGGSPAAGVSVNSSHVYLTKADAATGPSAAAACEACHPGGTRGAMHAKNADANVVLIANNTAVGINYVDGVNGYSGDNGIVLGGDNTVGTTEAEICWNCHDDATPDISEWDGTSASYDYGTVTQNDLNWLTTTWSSAQFPYKNGVLKNKPTVADPTNGTNNGGSTHGVMGGSAGVDSLGNIGCSYCHDVHNGTNGSVAATKGNPYLRGTWQSNPYREDGAPRSGGGQTIDSGSFGAVPRGTTVNNYGGYQIDQNNGSPALTANDAAGLCELCHGDGGADGSWTTTELGNIGGSTAWVSTGNSHAYVVKGGLLSGGYNLYDEAIRLPSSGFVQGPGLGAGARAGRPAMAYQHHQEKEEGHGFRGTDGRSFQDAPAITGWNRPYITDPGSGLYAWGATVDDSTVDGAYHQFSCSKCHNPHASRLPKLMITNCLDTKLNTWDDSLTAPAQGTANGASTDTVSAENGGAQYSNVTSAQNCHRLKDPSETNAGGNGWNTATPW